MILQGSFALHETVGDIYSFIKNYLRDKNDKFNISTTPPLKRYLKMEETIGNEKLYPNLLAKVGIATKSLLPSHNMTPLLKNTSE